MFGLPFRFDPALPASARKTYAIKAPKSTHTRPADCAEVECKAYLNGWQTTCDEATELGGWQANYIRKESGRGFTEERDARGVTVFTFKAGQRCFASDGHRVSIDRPALFVVRDGDWRGNPRGTRPYVHTSPDDWVDDFANHQQAIADRLQEG